jgi:hypothetical protein
MGDFARDLRRSFEAVSPWGDVNPLVTIGLTESILDLNLTEDQMYSAVRSYARQLSAQVHPDRQQTNISPERQMQIIEAFDFLQDQDNFLLALTDFKNLKAEDRRESRLLHQLVSNLRYQLSRFEGRENSITQAQEALDRERDHFQLDKLREPLKVPGLERNIRNLNEDLEKTEHLLQVERRESKIWKRKFTEAATYVVNLGEKPGSLAGISAFDAKWIVLGSFWLPKQDNPNPNPLNPKGHLRKDLSKMFSSLQVSRKKRNAIVKKWKESVETLKVSKSPYRRIFGITVLKLERGVPSLVFGQPKTSTDRIIGSLSPERYPFKKEQLEGSIIFEYAMSSLSPILQPGGFLVSLKIIPGKKASWNLDCPAFRMNTRYFILGVG